jgi:hypothetical protein
VIGTHMWAIRLFRLGPDRADDPLPAPTFPPVPGRGPGVQFNVEHVNEAFKRSVDNWRAYIGVWITIFGTVVGGAVPFLLDFIPYFGVIRAP